MDGEMDLDGPSVTPAEWLGMVQEAGLDREGLNRVVMDWLEVEGFQDAAKCFAEEAGVPCSLDSVGERIEIRRLMQEGNVSAAVDMVNAVDKDVMAEPAVHFAVLQQQLVETIRAGNIEEALALAADLAPKGWEGEGRAESLEAMERALSLLCFEDAESSPHGHLLSPQQRHRTASLLNAAVLRRQGHEPEPQLLQLLRLVRWMQCRVKSTIDLPCPTVEELVRATAPKSPRGGGATSGQ
eukprot:Hpha_TRINITY_DN34447_c0_g1::TRINITY_DN34447_c0_g1_i1::g.96147::m.96147